MISYTPTFKVFVWIGAADDPLPRSAGFEWSDTAKRWFTRSPYIAWLARRGGVADEAATRMAQLDAAVASSQALEPFLPGAPGLFPFQAAGVEHALEQYRRGRQALLLADDPGVGKSAQSLTIAKEMGFKRLLVICPASLRLNWLREIEMWHGEPAQVVLDGKAKLYSDASVVISYNLVGMVKTQPFDFIIIDESHNCHNADTQRTKLILGSNKTDRGLVDKTPSIFLTGTPTPNGRPSELWPIIYRCAPEIIDYMKYWTFVDRFCLVQDDGQGGVLIRGAKRQAELYARLRGSGFMIRRLKEDVLKDLPLKRYKMVVFPADNEARKVLHKESAFSADEILRHGAPVGSALPGYRREMGIAKVPQAVEYIRDMLDGGVEKIVVFAHHVEVIGLLRQALGDYGVEVITGATSATARQAAVDQFQKDPTRRVFIGNILAAGVGVTLTAAQDVVLVESSWVPGENDQAIDRLHRIGQIGSVLAHILVVEGSLDAKILGSAAHKAGDVGKILDGRVGS